MGRENLEPVSLKNSLGCNIVSKEISATIFIKIYYLTQEKSTGVDKVILITINVQRYFLKAK